MHQVLIFLKYPEPGAVKTRLAKAIGAEAAANIYRACVEQTLQNLEAWAPQALVYYTPHEKGPAIGAWLGPQWFICPQEGQDLGERLIQAFEACFSAGAQSVIVIGTDSPWIEGPDIEEARRALKTHAVVIGPALDGGYYLLGLKRPCAQLFHGIDWSGPNVMDQTLKRAQAENLTVKQLQARYDIDRAADVRRFYEEVKGLPGYRNFCRILQAIESEVKVGKK